MWTLHSIHYSLNLELALILCETAKDLWVLLFFTMVDVIQLTVIAGERKTGAVALQSQFSAD